MSSIIKEALDAAERTIRTLEAEIDAWAEKWMAERKENKRLRGLAKRAFERLQDIEMDATQLEDDLWVALGGSEDEGTI